MSTKKSRKKTDHLRARTLLVDAAIGAFGVGACRCQADLWLDSIPVPHGRTAEGICAEAMAAWMVDYLIATDRANEAQVVATRVGRIAAGESRASILEHLP